MSIFKTKTEECRFDKRSCSTCGGEAKIWSDKKWHCAIEAELGYTNMKGFCKAKKKRTKNAK